jgi:hypothetical protein
MYTLIEDDMDRNGHRLMEFTKEVLKETSKKPEDLQMKVQDQCLRLQYLLEIVQLAPTQGLGIAQEGIA